MSLLFMFHNIATVKKKGKTEPALDYFCPIVPYVRVYPTLPYTHKTSIMHMPTVSWRSKVLNQRSKDFYFSGRSSSIRHGPSN